MFNLLVHSCKILALNCRGKNSKQRQYIWLKICLINTLSEKLNITCFPSKSLDHKYDEISNKIFYI